MLHSLFTSFYVDYFVRRKLASADPAASAADPMTVFAFGQLAYAVWNGLNDFVFGWIGDRYFPQVHRRRYHRILFGGPLWAIVFAMLWNPGGVSLFPSWVHPSIQFSLMMILYDGFFSFTTVAFRALLTDISTSPRDRELCNAVAAIFHVLGSCGVWFASYYYEGGDSDGTDTSVNPVDSLAGFRWFMSVWAVAAGLGFVIAAVNGREVSLKPLASHNMHAAVKDGTRADNHPGPSAMFSFARETLKCQSMVVAVTVWAVQEYSCTFATNFFAMFLTLVCGNVLTVGQRSSLLLMSFVVPHIITLAVTPLIPICGKKTLISWLFGSRAVVGVATIFLARQVAHGAETHHRMWFASFLFLNRILTEAVCRLQALILSDIIDEDTVKFHRAQSLAASMNGLMSLVSKPFQSAAPVFTCFYLAGNGILLPSTTAANTTSSIDRATPIVTSLLGQTTLITAGIMWVVWREFYNLDGQHLSHVQRCIRNRSEQQQHPHEPPAGVDSNSVHRRRTAEIV